ncbi:MAG TPA: FAD-dependent monooxygenase [Streptosporangiaceae bacterium]
MPRVSIAGGSVGGLTTALVLRDAGCDVRVFERSSTALQARGAGIAALDTTLDYLLRRGGFQVTDVCSSTGWIRFLNRDGSVQHEQRHRYRFSSWNTIYRSLLSLLDGGRYQLGTEVTGFAEQRGTVTVTLGTGQRVESDLLVCADGVGSPARARLLPAVRPAYSGYVAWRGTVPERDLPAGARTILGDALTYQVLPGSHILVYPIPALDGSLTEGDRLINIVWYVNVAQGTPLDTLMTGRDGVRRPVSLPPGAATEAAVAGMRQAARDHLAEPIAEAVVRTPEPFVQVVTDIEVPRMVFGRICLAGDAAFAVRPHAAAGTAKAAADGWALAEELTAAGGDVPAALAAWEHRQLTLGRDLLARCREIGDSSQFRGTFQPGDPRLIFGLYGPGN